MTAQRPPGCREAVGSLPRHRKLVPLPGYGPGAGTAGCTFVVTSRLDYALPANRLANNLLLPFILSQGTHGMQHIEL